MAIGNLGYVVESVAAERVRALWIACAVFVHRTNRKLELRVEDKQVYSNLRVDLQHSPQEIRVYSFLWASCDELRCGMDASQYKDYVLVMLFIKYISDKYAGVPFA
ncbi:MAG: Type restriction-modification system, DNA-methyltransferase subunit [Anaerosporomusa subterranea]|jgi:hypothetical protein|nr:Type restriction-modification system, DNA-methyltransferase subunit [Anaerosporomusa subterranea]